MIQRETVVPQNIQDDLYLGFVRLVETQSAFFASIKEEAAPGDLLAVYKRMVEMCEGPLQQFISNTSRGLGVLMDLNATNKTWKAYMEGAILDSKAKGRELHVFLVQPRMHLNRLMAVISPFEEGKQTLRLLEQLEARCRGLAGKVAAEDVKAKSGVPGLSKLKEAPEKPSRRLLREGKFLTQAVGLGPGASKKKAKETGYWLCDDVLFWGSVKGPAKSFVRKRMFCVLFLRFLFFSFFFKKKKQKQGSFDFLPNFL